MGGGGIVALKGDPLKMICGVISARRLDELVKAAPRAKAGILELRIDTLKHPPLQESIKDIGFLIRDLQESGKKVIVTLRSRSEGGYYKGSRKEKARILAQLTDYSPHLIDVELREGLLQQLASIAKLGETGLIASLHEFTRPLTTKEIMDAMHEARESAGGEELQGRLIVKVVYRCRNPVDELHALNAVAGGRGSLISFAFGPGCKISRLLAPVLGAPYTYAREYGGSLVEGQPSVGEVVEAWRAMGLL